MLAKKNPNFGYTNFRAIELCGLPGPGPKYFWTNNFFCPNLDTPWPPLFPTILEILYDKWHFKFTPLKMGLTCC